ncbi:hypothetical protein Tco_0489839 [Tanacetum coccineum]
MLLLPPSHIKCPLLIYSFDMPIENNKPSDPVVLVFCQLTGMSPTNLRQKPGFYIWWRDIKESLFFGKSRKRVESSPIDSRNGKRVNSVPIDDEISKVLDTLKSGAIDKNLKFAIEHTSREDVVNTDVLTSDLDGIACDKGGGDFKFGRNDKTKGILKKPIGPLFKVQFGENTIYNPFGHKTMKPNVNAWNSSGVNGFGSTLLSNQYTADA